MEQKEKNEQVKFVISRFDNFYDSVNNKGNVYLTLNTFLLGGLISGYYALQKDHAITMSISFLFILAVVFCVAAILLTILATIPYMNFNGKDENGSLINYNDIASYTKDELLAKNEKLNETILGQDLLHQEHLLSKGLRRKFNLLWYGTIATTITVVAIFILGILLIKI